MKSEQLTFLLCINLTYELTRNDHYCISQRDRDWEDETYLADYEPDLEGLFEEGPFEYSLDNSDSEDEAITRPILVQPAVATPLVLYFASFHLANNVFIFLGLRSALQARSCLSFQAFFNHACIPQNDPSLRQRCPQIAI